MFNDLFLYAPTAASIPVNLYRSSMDELALYLFNHLFLYELTVAFCARKLIPNMQLLVHTKNSH